MTPAELTLTAAFGASALTGLTSLGVIWVQEARRRRARDKAALLMQTASKTVLDV